MLHNFASGINDNILKSIVDAKLPDYTTYFTESEHKLMEYEKSSNGAVVFIPNYIEDYGYYVKYPSHLNNASETQKTDYFKTIDLYKEQSSPSVKKDICKKVTCIVTVGILESGLRCILYINGFDISFDVSIYKFNEGSTPSDELLASYRAVFLNSLEAYTRSKITQYGKSVDEKTLNKKIPKHEFIKTVYKSPSSPYGRHYVARLYFANLKDRIECIKYFHEYKGMDTFSNEYNRYYNVLFRNRELKLAAPWRITKFVDKFISNDKRSNPNLVSSLGYQYMVGFVDINDISNETIDPLRPSLRYPNKGIMAFDIEVGNKDPRDKMADFPIPGHPKAEIKCICFSYSKKDNVAICPPTDTTPSIAGIDKYIPLHPAGYSMMCKITMCREVEIKGRTTIICKSEKDIIDTFIYMISKLRPMIIYEFNGQSFDWMWIYHKSIEYGISDKIARAMSYVNPAVELANTKNIKDWLESKSDKNTSFMVFNSAQMKTASEKIPNPFSAQASAHPWLKYNIIKTSAESSDYRLTPTYIGPLCLDLMSIMCILHANPPDKKLSSFLAREKLGSKMDIPYMLMAKIYEIDYMYKSKLGEVAYYNMPLDWFRQITRIGSSDLAIMNADVSEYCLYDAIRCVDLIVKSGVYLGKLALANDTPCNLYSAFYKADGDKILCRAYGVYTKVGYAYTALTRQNSDSNQSFQGATVFNPQVGLKIPPLSVYDAEMIDRKNNNSAPTNIIIKHKKLLPYVQMLLYNKRTYISTFEKFVALFAKCGLRYSDSKDNGYTKAKAELDALPLFMQQYIKNNNRIDLYKIDTMEGEWGKTHDFPDLTENELSIVKIIPNDLIIPFIILYPPTGLDFASLYPSIMMCYNLSPEKIIDFKDTISRAIAAMNKHNLIKFESKTKDLQKDLKSFTPDHTFLHTSEAKLDDIDKHGFGVYCFILKQLFDSRKREKVIKSKNIAQLESLEIDYQTCTNPVKKHELKEQIETCEYIVSKSNAKVTSDKVFMNTFYGKTGDRNSPQYNLMLANNVTERGRHAITSAYDYIVNIKKLVPYYGDTDSLYVPMLNKETARNIDKLYYVDCVIDREVYYKLLVMCTMESAEVVKKDINIHIASIVGKGFLNMDYEEVLLPFMLFGKKKYAGIKHENLYNTNFIKYFEKGLDFKKKGNNKLRQWISDLFMKTLFNVYNTHDVHIVAYNILDYVYTNFDRIPIATLRNTSEFRPPNKKNAEKSKTGVSIGNKNVITFLNRKKLEFNCIPDKQKREDMLSKMPQYGDRYEYYRIELGYDSKICDLGGKKKLDNQENMEFAWKFEMEMNDPDCDVSLDIKKYIENDICKGLSSYISSHPKYMAKFKSNAYYKNLIALAESEDGGDIDKKSAINKANKAIAGKIKDLACDDLMDYFNNRFSKIFNNAIIKTRLVKNVFKYIGVGRLLTQFLKVVSMIKSNNELAFELAHDPKYVMNNRIMKLKKLYSIFHEENKNPDFINDKIYRALCLTSDKLISIIDNIIEKYDLDKHIRNTEEKLQPAHILRNVVLPMETLNSLKSIIDKINKILE
jgi:DNA polymerase elongation subunit (family B)